MQQPQETQPIAVSPALGGVLAVAILANLLALWTVQWLPMADLGLYVQTFDIAAHYHDVQTGYLGWFIQPHVLDAGTLTSWLSHLLPFLNAWTVARVWLSMYVITLPLSLLALARAMRRSPWLTLYAIPLTWNALANAGLLNALVALPLLFTALALTRTAAIQGGVLRLCTLAVTLILLYFAHLPYFILAIGSVVFLILWYREDVWSLSRLWVVLPAIPLLAQWTWRRLVAAQAVALTHLQSTEAGPVTRRLPLHSLLARLYDWTFQFFTDHVDYLVAGVILVIWLVQFTLGEWDVAHANRGILDPRTFERRMFGRRAWTLDRVKRTLKDGSLLSGTFDRRRPRWVNIQQWLTQHGLEVLTLGWAALYLCTPTTLRGVPVFAELLPVPTLLLLTLWPRLEFSDWRVWLAIPVLGVGIGYAWQVRVEFDVFSRQEVGALPDPLRDIPEGSRVAFVDWQRDCRTAYKGALWHLPTAAIASERGGFMSDNPASRPGSTLQLRKGIQSPDLQSDFWLDPQIFDVDYVVLRSGVEPEEAENAAYLEHVWHNHAWWLFRVQHGDRGRMKVVTAGGRGGLAAFADCPRGSLLQGIVAQTHAAGIQSLVPLCQDLSQAMAATTPPTPGKRLGTAPENAEESALLCPRGQYVVALVGRASTYVGALQVQCANAPWPAAQFALTPTRLVGGGKGQDFDQHCPEGMVGVGLQGRFGDVTDQVGLACAELETW